MPTRDDAAEPKGHVRLGDLLVRRGVLSAAQRDEALAHQERQARPLGQIVEEMFGLAPTLVEQAWAEQYAQLTRRVDPRREEVDPRVLTLIERRQAWQFSVLPLRADGREIMVCTTQDALTRALRFVSWRVPRLCYFVLASEPALVEALETHYPMDGMTHEFLARRGLAG